MTALLLPFATRLSDGKLVSPDEVERGRACNCSCPGCNVEVIAKQGTEREWHFAHAKGEKCAEGYEVSIHELAKQMLRQRKELLLPSLIAKVSGIDAYGRLLEEHEPVLESHMVKLDECKTGFNLGGVNVDALGRLKGHEILIEITVFHRLMPDKQERLVETEISSIQINLEQFQSRQATRELLEKAIFENENIRRWIYHPKLQPALQKAQAKLDVRLQDSKSNREKDEALRREKMAALRLEPEKMGLNFVPGETFSGGAIQRSSLMLRSALPSTEQIASSTKKLAIKTGASEACIISIAATYKDRSQLGDYTPESFVNKWCELLGLSIVEVEDFLVDAGYLLRR